MSEASPPPAPSPPSVPRRFRTFALVTFPVLVGHVLLPVSFVIQLRSASPRGLATWMATLFLAGSYAAFIVVAGAWSWFGRATRHVIAALPLLGALATFPGAGSGARLPSPVKIDLAIRLILGAIFLALTLQALLGRRWSGPALDLVFPLRGGTFIVGQGGSRRAVNYHAVNASQRYALDILQLNAAGVRARGFYPADPERYAIFGAEVVSPCDGVVAAAVDGLPDLAPPARDPVNRAGNHLALECEGATIYLAHLMRGTVSVRPGERVRAGQLLGRVGNSGNTTEPHLHIHAEQGPYPGKFSGNPGLPIRLGGRFRVRNDRVVA